MVIFLLCGAVQRIISYLFWCLWVPMIIFSCVVYVWSPKMTRYGTYGVLLSSVLVVWITLFLLCGFFQWYISYLYWCLWFCLITVSPVWSFLGGNGGITSALSLFPLRFLAGKFLSRHRRCQR